MDPIITTSSTTHDGQVSLSIVANGVSIQITVHPQTTQPPSPPPGGYTAAPAPVPVAALSPAPCFYK